MGTGGSKQFQIVQPQANIAENTQPKVLQEQGFSHERPTEHETNQTNSLQDDIEWEVLHMGTLDIYKTNYPEQADKLQTVFEYMQVLRSTFTNNLKRRDRYTEQVHQTISNMFDLSFRQLRKHTTIADFLVEIDGAAVLQKYAQNCFKDFYEMTGESDDESADDETLIITFFSCFPCLITVLATIQNIADNSDEFCSASATAGVVRMCLENIERLNQENDDWQNEDEESEPLQKISQLIGVCLEILLNISRRLRDRDLFPNSAKTLLFFARVNKTRIATSALLCLAYLVNEETNHLISADENLLRFILTLLNKACTSEDRQYDGFSAKELAEGLSHLAINDNNKRILGKQGAIRVLTLILQTSNDDEERASGARALWMLAFDDSNKDVIRQEQGALDTLRALHHSENQEVQKAAAGALWEIEGKTARNNAKKTKKVTGNHVMISYQWDSQDVLVEVKNKLQDSGYRVWMDLEQMGGSTLEAMAKAVEGAAVVLVCVSQRYKDSPNCRSEAEYAYELRKDVIPLMMQHNYKADGWLGILVGTKLRIGFQSKQAVDSGVAELIKELGGRGKDGDATDGLPEAVIRPSETSVVTAPRPVTDVSGWTNQDVKKWFTEIGLGQVCKEDISEFDGKTLIHLQKLRAECPDYFYKCLERTLRLETMFLVFKFTDELEKLFGY